MPAYESQTSRLSPEQPGVCALVQDMLPFYLEGDGSPESRRFIESHLDQCSACSYFLAGARSAQEYLRRDTQQRSSVIIRDQRVQQVVEAGRRQVMWRVFATAAGSILVVVGVVVALSRILHSAPAPYALPPTIIPTVEPVGSRAQVYPEEVEAPALPITPTAVVIVAPPNVDAVAVPVTSTPFPHVQPPPTEVPTALPPAP